ncbi:DUF5675 family protein [Tenuifilum thalassicum]|uniref:DUF5675 domain-containing protein n=1 Tax=Tenuifilum thalassicum TaxID=2590900 RepID=A0A7D4BZY5_9BACT|nr:DUF5675 family protein [Tenuifilum thalassicum]QKG79904.1 hypothetical protein FHG85_06385 [Tenuifilum thalassicum]
MDYPTSPALADRYTHLLKPQWDQIHNPQSTTGLFDGMEEGAMFETLFIPIMIDYINQIRKGNGDKLKEISMKIATGLAEATDIELGGKLFSYLKVSTTGFNIFQDKESTATLTTSTGSNVTLPGERPRYSIDPSESSKTTYTKNNVNYVKYQFHELQTKKNPPPYADTKEPTGTMRIEIVVKKNERMEFEKYLYNLKASDTIRIYITRTSTGINSTVGTLKTDDGVISGYTVELPRGNDSECKTPCGDNTIPYDCYCIAEGIYNFEINTKVYKVNSPKNYSLRITSAVPDGRSGVLVHAGRDDAKGWSMGCILPMPNEPNKDLNYEDRFKLGRNNTIEESLDFTKEILDWVRLREAEIKERNKGIEKVVKQVIITKTI